MLPQPNFGPPSQPGGGDDEDERPPKQVGRLRIALWVEAVCGVLAGNILTLLIFSSRSQTIDDIIERYEAQEGVEDVETLAQETFDFYQSSGFLTLYLSLAIGTALAAIVVALCAMRLKTRLRAVRWTALGGSVVLGVAAVLMMPMFALLVAPWMFASILSLWWLLTADVRHWADQRRG
ncbi:AdipoR/hemolysin III family protein [Glycomyces xiaoerkulensis]|uniref:hypothetical protein n=1 Tax=Glycomyces xiaoerkulensis TaxID=2038139 RepID=UPI000C2666BC|nr:hypothetical protein [Glycomyces xiaoerkulensis]